MSEAGGESLRVQQFFRLLHASSGYRDIGRRGEPCPAFPALTATSTPDDIQRSAAEAYERILTKTAVEHPEAPINDDPAVREVAQLVFEIYADEYVAGLREREATA